MDLEKLNAELVPRSAYEAVDFGFRLARAHYKQLLLTFAIIALPPALLLAVVFGESHSWLGLLFWWLKPVWERPLLFTLSRALFSETPPIRDVLHSWSAYGWRDLVMSLSLRRLSPTRSFDLPVGMLENAQGAERSSRIGILHRGQFPGAAVTSMFVLVNVEGALVLAMLGLVQVLTPALFDWSVFDWLNSNDVDGATHVSSFLFAGGLLASMLIAPFYVGVGFSLYLHRRTELEAWDLELAFRRIANRLEEKRARSKARAMRHGAGLAVVALFALVFSSGESKAESNIRLDPEAARASIESILEGPDFHEIEQVSLPRFVLDWELEDPDASESESWFPSWWVDWITSASQTLGGFFEVLIVTMAILLVIWIGIRIWALQKGEEVRGQSRPNPRDRASEVMGLDIREASLPDDLVTAAREAASGREPRKALALLYRGALARSITLYHAEIARGSTESECLERSRRVLPASGTRYFETLTHAWLACAYGDRVPSPLLLETLVADWSDWFEARVTQESTDPEGGGHVN